jgi:hypothetical protein
VAVVNVAVCPITADAVRRLRCVAVMAEDSSGVTRFDGDPRAIEAKAKAHPAKSDTVWKYETRAGHFAAWPRIAGKDKDAANLQSSEDAAADRALYLAERFAEQLAKAYDTAYKNVTALVGGAINALSDANTSLVNRMTLLEETVASAQQDAVLRSQQATQHQSDELAFRVIGRAIDKWEGKGKKPGEQTPPGATAAPAPTPQERLAALEAVAAKITGQPAPGSNGGQTPPSNLQRLEYLEGLVASYLQSQQGGDNGEGTAT